MNKNNPRGAGRKFGSKNKKGSFEKPIAVRLPKHLYDWCCHFDNASKYIRTLVELDYKRTNIK